MHTGSDRQTMDANGGTGLGGVGARNVPGKIFSFRFKFIAFKALLMGFISRYPHSLDSGGKSSTIY